MEKLLVPKNVEEEAQRDFKTERIGDDLFVIAEKHTDKIYYKQLIAVAHAKNNGFALFSH